MQIDEASFVSGYEHHWSRSAPMASTIGENGTWIPELLRNDLKNCTQCFIEFKSEHLAAVWDDNVIHDSNYCIEITALITKHTF